MAKKKIITIDGNEISLIVKGNEEYISLTDMAKGFEGEAGEYIRNWLRNASTVQYLGVWEKVHNESFNLVEFHQIKSEIADNAFFMSVKKWINRTNAIGMQARAGRYGGTFAHNEIALQFAAWISPEFHVYLVKEFKRLKTLEAEQNKETLDWSIKRVLTKLNYQLQTDAIKQHLIPPILKSKQQGFIYASEADILNVALFGMTAKEWRLNNADKKGNVRDHATGMQLVVLSNLESLNAEFIKEGLSQDERIEKLNKVAIYQMQILTLPPSLKLN